MIEKMLDNQQILYIKKKDLWKEKIDLYLSNGRHFTNFRHKKINFILDNKISQEKSVDNHDNHNNRKKWLSSFTTLTNSEK